MLQVRNLLVRSLSLTNNELSWEYAQSSEDPLNYTFQIFRSESVGGEFDTLTPTFTNKFYFIDNMLPPPNKWRKLYYKLRVTDTIKSYAAEFGPAFVGYPDNKYVLEITRVERLVFKNFAGCKLYILPMKTFGLSCTCWDPVRGKSAKANCSSCYNVGIAGGFNTAIEVYGQVGQMSQQVQSVPAGGMPMQMTGTNIKIINYPLVRSGDLIINPLDNLRYRAVTITSTKLAGHTIHQDIAAAVADMSDSVYDINLNGIDVFQMLDPVAQTNMKAVY